MLVCLCLFFTFLPEFLPVALTGNHDNGIVICDYLHFWAQGWAVYSMMAHFRELSLQ